MLLFMLMPMFVLMLKFMVTNFDIDYDVVKALVIIIGTGIFLILNGCCITKICLLML